MENIKEENETVENDLLNETLKEATGEEESNTVEKIVSDAIDGEVMSDLEKVVQERDEIKDQLMRSLAENENIRKRFEKERREAESYGITKLARDILTVHDNLQRALDLADDILDEKSIPMIEGLELTKKDLLETFKRNKIEKIEPSAGEKFDPKFHQAMFEGPSEKEEKGTIMQVLSIGFSIGDRLLRAAHVAVSSGKTNNDTISDSEEK